jgi:hypothetical protein
MKMKIIPSLLTALLLTTGTIFSAGPDFSYEEGITFEIKTLPLEHQGPNVVDVKVHFDYKPDLKDKEYPDFEPLQAMAAKFLKEYPDNGDFWEVVIKKLSTAYLEKAPNLASVAIEMQVYPTKTVAYYHTIHCTASRNE